MRRIFVIGALAGAALFTITDNAFAPPPPPPPPISALINRNIRASSVDYSRLSVVAAPQLWVHVISDAEMQLVERNAKWLSSQRFGGRFVTVHPTVRVSVGPSVSQLRFFKTQDRQPAQELLSNMAPFIPHLQLQDLSGSYQNVTWVAPGRLELWLAPNLKQFGPTP